MLDYNMILTLIMVIAFTVLVYTLKSKNKQLNLDDAKFTVTLMGLIVKDENIREMYKVINVVIEQLEVAQKTELTDEEYNKVVAECIQIINKELKLNADIDLIKDLVDLTIKNIKDNH